MTAEEVLSSIIHCCWVISGREKFTAQGVRDVTGWILSNAGKTAKIAGCIPILKGY